MEIILPDWSDLPAELLAKIGKQLHTRIDALCFRAICRSFRLSVPLPPKPVSPYTDLKIPLLELLNPFCDNVFVMYQLIQLYREHYIVLNENTIYAIEPLDESLNTGKSTKTWFVAVEELSSGKVRLQDPLPGFSFHKLPKSLNLLDYRVKEIIQEHTLGLDIGGKGKLDSEKPVCFTMVAVSTCLHKIDDDFAFMVIYGSKRELGLWRNVDKKCTKIDYKGHHNFVEIVYHDNKFYALDYMGFLLTVDPKSKNVRKVANRIGNARYLRLLKSCKHLSLIQIKLYKDSDGKPGMFTALNVFKLDEDKCDWVHVANGLLNGLEGRMVFVRPDCSFSLVADEVLEYKRNCIYFVDPSVLGFYNIDSGVEAGFFDLENRVLGPFSLFPEYSKIFCPPPTWLKYNCSSDP